MPSYFYDAVSAATGRRTSGHLNAGDRLSALRELTRARNLAVLALNERGRPTPASFLTWLAYEADGLGLDAARLTWFRAMAHFTKHNVHVQEALATSIARCPNRRFTETIRGMLQDLTFSGIKLADAMAARPQDFRPYQTSMVRAGETFGKGIAAALVRIVKIEERRTRAKSQFQRALYYPALLMCGVIGLLIFTSTVFVPQFLSSMRKLDDHVTVPAGLNAISAIGAVFVNPWSLGALVLGLAALGALGVAVLRAPPVRLGWDRTKFQLPRVGLIYRWAVLAVFCRLLSGMLTAGINTQEALELIGDALDSAAYGTAVTVMRLSMQSKKLKLGEAMAMFPDLFDPTLAALVTVGERSKNPAELLDQLAADYDDEVDGAIAGFSSIVEPLLIAAMAVPVTVVLGTIYGSMYALISSIH